MLFNGEKQNRAGNHRSNWAVTSDQAEVGAEVA